MSNYQTQLLVVKILLKFNFAPVHWAFGKPYTYTQVIFWKLKVTYLVSGVFVKK